VKHSEARFDKELGAQKEREERQRRIEVRSEPLLKFRAELARMGVKFEAMLRTAAVRSDAESGLMTELATQKLREAQQAYDDYLTSGDLEYALLMLDDKEITERADDIHNLFVEAYLKIIRVRGGGKQAEDEMFTLARQAIAKIQELQSLVNEKLDGLGSQS